MVNCEDIMEELRGRLLDEMRNSHGINAQLAFKSVEKASGELSCNEPRRPILKSGEIA